jgi:hypothetical protein
MDATPQHQTQKTNECKVNTAHDNFNEWKASATADGPLDRRASAGDLPLAQPENPETPHFSAVGCEGKCPPNTAPIKDKALGRAPVAAASPII